MNNSFLIWSTEQNNGTGWTAANAGAAAAEAATTTATAATTAATDACMRYYKKVIGSLSYKQ